MTRLATFMLAAQLSTGMFSFGQTSSPKPPSRMECVTDMAVPVYRGVVWYASITGTAEATIILDSRGHAASIDVKGSHPGLADLVKHSLATAGFDTRCGGEKIVIHFAYRLVGDASSEPINSVRWLSPDTF